ncbi:GMC family oxidoreductase [Mycolicibacterium sp. XJ879]
MTDAEVRVTHVSASPSGSHRSVLIVGAGTSGSVLAARLSESPALSVTLLEAGGTDDYGDEITNPARAHEVWSSLANSDFVPMKGPAGDIPMLQGRITGGTSAINYLATLRGQPQDYDAWEAAGLAGWGWSDVQRYFIAVESDLDFGRSAIHGNAGPLTVSRWKPGEHSAYQAAFAEGLRQVGIKPVADVNDPAQLPGIGVFPATLNASRQRMTTSTAYLTTDVRSRPNLLIRTGATVARLFVDDGRTRGVMLDTGEELHADEVIVTAGAVETPTLLLRSGIGPREQLTARGLPVHADLPVGSTMSDHLGTALIYHHDAPRAGSGGPAQSVLVGASNGKDIDYHAFPTPLLGSDDPSTFMMLVFLLRSTGRGGVVLDADPAAPPRVTAPPLPDDVGDRLGQAFRQIAVWEQSPAAQAIGCRAVEPHDLTAPTAVADALSRITVSYGHMVGTCPMGQVLDAQCRVLGVSGLRVADASAMPTIPAGNTYLGCVMIAERIAALITSAIRHTATAPHR